MRKFVVGFLWFLIFYFGACAATGAIAGARATSKLPPDTAADWANQVAIEAATQTVLELRAYFFAGALGIAVVGSTLGWLPGTRSGLQAVQRLTMRDAGVQPIDAPVGLSQTADLYQRRNDA
ncbi:MAG TPA: hypothetical protein VFE62_11890 [Gemmataceae bacterium]|nr:hypothetical protein [Gemmataceae bacterium]